MSGTPVIDIPDAKARHKALNHTRSFIVSAPAGSGKTGLLTQRVLKLLAHCEHPEEVVAITFTRKAAQEMRQRILEALREADAFSGTASDASCSPHDALTRQLATAVLKRDRENHWQLTLLPHRLRIQTIDSFSQSLVHQLPFSTDGGTLEPTEQVDHLYREAVQRFFAAFKKPATQNDIALLLQHTGNNLGKLENLLCTLLQNRLQWLWALYETRQQDAHDFIAHSLDSITEELLAQLKPALQPWLPHLAPLANFAGENLPSEALLGVSADLGTKAADLPQWLALAELLTKKEKTIQWRTRYDKRQGFPAKSKDHPEYEERKKDIAQLTEELKAQPELADLFADLKALPAGHMSDTQWNLLDALTRLLPLLVAEFHLLCQQLGQCDFNEMAQSALVALGGTEDPTELALKLDYKISHILVDEFQDTSLPQLQLLERLTAGWQPGDGKTLFAVGDAMQSCYSFRDANVGIFLGAIEHGIGTVPLEHLQLTVNFRSRGNIVAWNNRIFANAFPVNSDINRGAVTYQPADPFNPGSDQSGIHCLGLTDPGDNGEADAVLAIVEKHLQQDDDTSIAILVRAKNHLPAILNRLRDANHRWQSSDVDRLTSRMAVVDLYTLTRALTNLSDRVAWLSLLRAPWCGLDMADLHCVATHPLPNHNPLLSNSRKQQYPWLWGQIQHHAQLPLSDSGHQQLEKLKQVFSAALHQRARKNLRTWVEGVWLALGGPATIANPAERHSPERFFELLEKHSGAGQLADAALFEKELETLWDKAEEASRIQVMSIHKAKGLEFDTVILPGLERKGRSDDRELLLWHQSRSRTGQNRLLLSPPGAGNTPDPIYEYLRREKGIRESLESLRLLYIGCTRAITHLYLLASFKTDDNSGERKAPQSGSLINHLWPVLETEMSWHHPQQSLHKEAEPPAQQPRKPVLNGLLRLPDHWKIPAWPEDHTLQAWRPPASLGDQTPPAPDMLLNRQQRHWGTVLHAALETIANTGPAHWTGERIAAQQPFWRTQLLELSGNSDFADSGCQRIADTVKQVLADDQGRWLLDNSHQQSVAELPLLDTERELSEYIIDRTFIHDGVRWVIDYKSSEPEANQTLEDFLAEETERYRPQLQQYCRLAAGLEPSLPVKAALYFPLLPRLHLLLEG